MSITPTTFTPLLLSNKHFQLLIKQDKRRTRIDMTISGKFVNTKDFPLTHSILKNKLPTILSCMCFNYDNAPFAKEVRHTEIGHLFEHMLLEYLCLGKIADGARNATFRGQTDWNWEKNTFGTFHITISTHHIDFPLFLEALQKTLTLMTTIFESNPLYTPSYYLLLP